MLFDFHADWMIKMTKDEKIITRIKEVIANYGNEHRLKINKPNEDHFKDCLGRAVIELQKFIGDKGKGDVVIILRDVSLFEMLDNDYDSVATIYKAKGLWDEIYDEK